MVWEDQFNAQPVAIGGEVYVDGNCIRRTAIGGSNPERSVVVSGARVSNDAERKIVFSNLQLIGIQ